MAIVSDSVFSAECLRLGISRSSRFLPVVSAGRNDALSKIVEALPDLALLHLPSDTTAALTLTREITVRSAAPKVILLGVDDSDSAALACIEAGSSGWLAPSASLEDLISLMTAVSEGEVSCSPTLAYRMYGRLAELAAAHQLCAGEEPCDLTLRESEIASLVGQSKSNDEIAKQLHLSVHTVKRHVHNVMEKLRVSSRAELACGTASRRPCTSTRSQPIPGNNGVELSAGACGL